MQNLERPIAEQYDLEAARHLALSSYYLQHQDFRRTVQYARRPLQHGASVAAYNMLSALVHDGRHDAALELAAVLLAGPNVAPATRSMVLSLMVGPALCAGSDAGDCRDAFAVCHELANAANLHPSLPKWRGESLRGRCVLVVCGEAGRGGFGDHIFWSRLIPCVVALGADVVVQTTQPLARLMHTIPGVVAVCGMEDRPKCDFTTQPAEIAHIVGLRRMPTANPFRVAPSGFPVETHNIALSWGASWGTPMAERSCALSELSPLMSLSRTALYAVQKGPHGRQLYPPPQGFNVHDLAPRIGDFLDTARALMGMDAVAAVDSSVANLACVLGRPTFVLVPRAADWKWSTGGRSSLLPAARVYQQTTAGDWSQPIARLARDLHDYLQTEARRLPQDAEFTTAGVAHAKP